MRPPILSLVPVLSMLLLGCEPEASGSAAGGPPPPLAPAVQPQGTATDALAPQSSSFGAAGEVDAGSSGPGGSGGQPGSFVGSGGQSGSLDAGLLLGDTAAAPPGPSSPGHDWCRNVGGSVKNLKDFVWLNVWSANASDAWLSGYEVSGPVPVFGGKVSTPHLFHWDGKTLCGVETTAFFDGNLNRGAEIQSIWGASPNDVWAVGEQEAVAHWDGKTWRSTAIRSPNYLSDFSLVTGSGSNNVVAVLRETFLSKAYRWDGRAWSLLEVSKGFGGQIWPDDQGRVWMALGTVSDAECVVSVLENGTRKCKLSFPTGKVSVEAVRVTGSGHQPWVVVEFYTSPRHTEWLYTLKGDEWETHELQGGWNLWAQSNTDVWATGRGGTARFDGETWQTVPVVPAAATAPEQDWVLRLSGSGADDVWGIVRTGGSDYHSRIEFEYGGGQLIHSNGVTWRRLAP